MTTVKQSRLPEWLRISSRLDHGESYEKVRQVVEDNHLHTICTSGNCPNIGECWRAGTATFMILGDICTRSCRFCGVTTGRPLPPDRGEPQRIAVSIKKMGLKHAVITSVDRDDLTDRGASFWAETINAIKEVNRGLTIETLIPDFDGREDLILLVIQARPDVISHNLETVRRLTPLIRTKAQYDTSLAVIRQISRSGIVAKSGIMLGLGETEDEILETMDDLLASGCMVMTIGQYLRPTRSHLPVAEWVHPDQFRKYEQAGLQKGFRMVESHPLVRSSFHAEKHVISGNEGKDRF